MRAKSATVFCLLAVLLAGRSEATPIVVPTANTAVEGATLTFGPLQSGILVFQYALPSSEFAGVAIGSQFTSIGWRADEDQFTAPPAPSTYTDYEIRLSTSLNAPGSLSTTFAANVGADVTLVRDGSLTFNTNALTGGGSPNPFFTISFTTPYTYLGGDLLIELRHTANPTLGSFSGFAVDGLQGNGVAAGGNFGATEGFSNQNYPVTQLNWEAGATVPEPASLLLLGTGLVGIAARRYRHRRRQ